ncbi:MAG: 8-oxo-dGDP phosphatase [Pseudonocardiales bacterium]|nr:8-oxo-dGDP phosphatase [Pseudonocardiales bacterium]
MSGDQAAEYPVVGTELIYEGAVISLRRDRVRMSDDSIAEREVVVHPGAVGVVALDADGRVLLVNQYRHPVRRRLDELPAGLLDKDGESPLDAAKRELVEEAGVSAREWHVLVDLNPSPGMSDEAIRIYLARGVENAVDDGFTPEHEEMTLTVSRVPLDEAVGRIWRGALTNAAAVAGLLAAARAQADGWSGLRPADAPWPDRDGR